MGFAVLACTACGRPMAVDERHAATSCPACGQRVEHRRARVAWRGPDARLAGSVLASLKAASSGSSWRGTGG
ncbi:MAG TPA: DUF1922 domain-containing protein, partial [Candidatus Thermoplasmatota archaeon]|nr:DUF1922 domain-containing protein [Candidatus Thermoplasmatota archaeon]